MADFVHLHLHTQFSLLDGAARIEKLVKVCRDYGMPGFAITDHGNMHGVIRAYKAVQDINKENKKKGIEGKDLKLIVGCEFYVADNLYEKTGRSKFSHLILLAKNQNGYKNLCMLNTIAYRDGFYYKPRIDYKTLEKYSADLICLSACMAGDIPQYILARRYDEADKMALWFKNLFGDDFYLEFQNHHLDEDAEINAYLYKISEKFNIKRVATNDVHYIYREDAEMQDVLMCVQMQKTLDDPNRMKFSTDEFYFKTYEEMKELFPDDESLFSNTIEIFNKCQVDFSFGKYIYPTYDTGPDETPEQLMRKLVEEGLKKKYPKETPEIRARIEEEMQVIKDTGFIDYFLIVWDYINAARTIVGCPVGPGRGSGAGSIVAYLMGITNIDPLKYELFFERFLNKERVSAPDFDVDFADDKRDLVIEYVRQKYGSERVVKIITFGTMAAKNAIKDVARVLKMPYSEGDRITKAMPNNVPKPRVIEKCFGLYIPKEGDKDFGMNYTVPELAELYKENDQIKRLIDIAIKVEGMPRNCSTHACGIVIGRTAVENYIPLSRNGDDIMTQYDKDEVDGLGLLKMDFLGLRNLNDIDKSLKYIKENYNVDIDFDHMDVDDPNVYQLISSGNTKAIFQIESTGFQKWMKELKPTCIEDIIAMVSLYRPGPMDSIPRYIKNKHNPDQVVYDHPRLEPILGPTYGCIVYQEQVMKIVQVLAGYTLGRADKVRKMMGKKKVDEMIKEREIFLHGLPASENHGIEVPGAVKYSGCPEEVAIKIWDEMKDFAKYAFNKSHAAAYSMITYQTAWLKNYYEPEFLTAVLNNRITNADEIKNYVTYAKEEKIEVLPPDINKSMTMFSVKNNKIRFGLAALKNVGIGVIDGIIAERERGGDYTSIDNFLERVDGSMVNKRCIESLILSGAFDCFGKKRSQLMQVYPQIIDRCNADRKVKTSGQFSLFDSLLKDDNVNEIVYPNISEYDDQTKLKLEKEVVGVYVSGHPLSKFIDRFENYNLTSDMLVVEEKDGENVDDEASSDDEIVEYSGITDGMEVTCGGLIVDIRKLLTKNSNKEMAVAKVEDLYGTIDLMFFPQSYAKLKSVLQLEKMYTIKGKLSIRSGEAPIVMVDDMVPWDTTVKAEEKPIRTRKLYLKYDVDDAKLNFDIMRVLKSYPGDTEVVVRSTSDGNSYRMDVKVNPTSFLMNELYAYLEEGCIKLL